MFLAMDGNYREGRWFARWMKAGHTEPTKLPRSLAQAIGQDTAPFGDGYGSVPTTPYRSPVFSNRAPSTCHL